MDDFIYPYPITERSIPSLSVTCTLPPCFDAEEVGKSAFKKWKLSIRAAVYGSPEYKTWVKAKKESEGIPVCVVSGITNLIELHHYPLFLGDYIDIVIRYFAKTGLTLSSLAIADCVVRLHYDDIICYTFLSKSFHKKFHESGDVLIPDEEIRGDLEATLNHPIISKYITAREKSQLELYVPELASKYLADVPVEEDDDSNLLFNATKGGYTEDAD